MYVRKQDILTYIHTYITHDIYMYVPHVCTMYILHVPGTGTHTHMCVCTHVCHVHCCNTYVIYIHHVCKHVLVMYVLCTRVPVHVCMYVCNVHG